MHTTYYNPQGTMIDVWNCRALETLHDGPAGTGKTRGILELVNVMAMSCPKSRFAFFRKRRIDLAETILKTFETLVLPEGSPITKGPSRATRREYTYPNGSEILLMGMDDSERTKGLEVDWVVMFEATEFTEDDHELILRALRYNGTPYKRIISECNPGPPQHWLLQRALSGRMTRIQANHKDNGRFWDAKAGKWTEDGVDYVTRVLGNYTGVRRSRLLEGKWVADSGSVFDLDVLLKHRQEHGCPPLYTGELVFTHRHEERDYWLTRQDEGCVKWEDRAGDALEPSPWKLWCDLVTDERGRLRPMQHMRLVLAADISMGQHASNTVICVGDATTGRKIAEFASASITPEEVGRLLAAAALWFGGETWPLIIWETNGPGGNIGSILTDLQWPNIFRRTTGKTGEDRELPGGAIGWTTTRQTKMEAALALRNAYAAGEFINPSTAAIDETMAYIRYKTGAIGPAKLVEESVDAHATHGDRAIADMLLYHGMRNEYVPIPPAVSQSSLLDQRARRAQWG